VTVSDTTQQEASDARTAPRVTVAWRARVITGPQSCEDVRVVNISADGLGFVSENAFPAGAVLHMALAIPDPKDRSQFCYVAVHVKVAFHVIANSKFRIGSRLAQADESTRRLIDHWVSKG
jgi:hypothetical protein